ncbi:MAG: sigma-70 family RNA polymerase sigma factor [Lachnospiraceae bacterium]|nr:sigma-70 family RNA polymerase sigma factor [Lachnospiraceae bacterium]
MDDRKIIELYFARDEQAIKETEAKYGKLLYRIADNILNTREDAEECVNDTYLGLWNAIPPTKPDNFMAFISRIVRNLSLKRLDFLNRDKRSAELTVSLNELADILPDEKFMPRTDDEELGKIISEFLHKQKQDVRKVFVRKYYFFDSIGQIAERYSFTESKVKNMLFTTRKKLKDYLIRKGVDV